MLQLVLLSMSYYERNLPHWHPDGAPLFVTWRLAGSLPACLKTDGLTPGQQFRAVDRLLDAAVIGPLWLQDTRVAAMLVATLKAGEAERDLYRLRAFVVMPNHVHALLYPNPPLAAATQWIKGTTARQANQLLGRPGGPFWQHESYDHWARSESEIQRIVRYIENNPVAAGLAISIEHWPWSSAAQAEAYATAP